MKKSDLSAFAQTLFVQRPDETCKFEQLLIERYLLNVDIQDKSAMTDVEMVFLNPNEHSVAGIFIIPFSKKADSVDFEIRVDGKDIPIKLAKKDKLEKVYGHALQSTDIDILEFVGSSHLQTKVMQIPAGVSVVFRYYMTKTFRILMAAIPTLITFRATSLSVILR